MLMRLQGDLQRRHQTIRFVEKGGSLWKPLPSEGFVDDSKSIQQKKTTQNFILLRCIFFWWVVSLECSWLGVASYMVWFVSIYMHLLDLPVACRRLSITRTLPVMQISFWPRHTTRTRSLLFCFAQISPRNFTVSQLSLILFLDTDVESEEVYGCFRK